MKKDKFVMLDVETYKDRVMIGLLNTKNEHIIIDGIEDIRRRFAPVYNNQNNKWIGFNSFKYDLPMIEYVLNGGDDPYSYSKSIIKSIDDLQDYKTYCSTNNLIFSQRGFEEQKRKPSWVKNSIDLYILLPKIARCSLKEMGHRLGYDVLENLPYPYDSELTNDQWEHVKSYNRHDLNITKLLWGVLEPEYECRMALEEIYGFHTLWSGAAGLSKKVFKLNNVKMHDGIMHCKGLSEQITGSDLYTQVYDTLRSNQKIEDKLQNIKEIGVDHELNGVKFDLKLGGFHSIPEAGIYHDIYEYDFASLYPNMCIENNIGGSNFNKILKNLLVLRAPYKKSGEKAKSNAFKLLVNTITGCFRDPYAIDSVYSIYSSLSMLLGGQFNMLDLIARLPKDMVILSNTDAIWCREKLPQSFLDDVTLRTGLILEEDHYDTAIVKDVNSYCCINNGKIVKRKKEFLEPCFDHNVKAPIIQKMVLENIMNETPIEDTMQLGVPLDYMFFTKGNRNTTLQLDGVPMVDQKVRFFVSNSGNTLSRKSEKTESRIVADSPITMCMNYDHFDKCNLNTDWYLDRAEDILNKVGVELLTYTK